MANNEFLVSVANAVLRDPNTGSAIAYGTTNISSAFTLTMQKTDVRGGINNPLLYSYFHDRQLEVKVEEATFNKNILALNAGTSILNSSVVTCETDCVVLSSGSGTLSGSAVAGKVSVFLPNGTMVGLVASGSTIYVASASAMVSPKVNAIYNRMATSDQITIESTTPPTVVDLTLIAEVRDNTGIITEYLQIDIPRFQVAGNYTLSFAANGVSSQSLEGVALLTASTDCTSGDYYAKATWVPAV